MPAFQSYQSLNSRVTAAYTQFECVYEPCVRAIRGYDCVRGWPEGGKGKTREEEITLRTWNDNTIISLKMCHLRWVVDQIRWKITHNCILGLNNDDCSVCSEIIKFIVLP